MMKKSNKFKLFIAATGLIASSASAQLVDEKDVSITLDMQPVLQLDMTTPDQIEFVFDEISEYQAGITHYAATILKVSSTVNWDLYAVGRSQGNNGPTLWDQQVDYGSDNVNAIPDIPLSLLEIRQSRPNPASGNPTIPDVAGDGVFSDYSSNFQNALTPDDAYADATNGGDRLANENFGSNSIYVGDGSGTPPGIDDKYIAGHAGTTGSNDFVPGGTYLNQSSSASDYYYTLDYRILPGLPAVFPMAYNGGSEALAGGTYAEPGVYTMYVQYVLLEDQ